MEWHEQHPSVIQLQQITAEDQCTAAREALRPSMMLRPRLSIDGNQWCALYGENIQDGVAGFGSSPDAAYRDFDKAWLSVLPARGGEKTITQVIKGLPVVGVLHSVGEPGSGRFTLEPIDEAKPSQKGTA